MTNKKRAWTDKMLSEAFIGLTSTNSTLLESTKLLNKMLDNLAHRVSKLEEKS